MVNSLVNGKSQVYGVIGNPIKHTFSPTIQNTFARAMNKNIIYAPFLVKAEGLSEAIKGAYELGIGGLNVTVPHKKEVMKCLCGIDKRAEAIGAVNTLKYTPEGYVGYNTDVIGAYYALKNSGVEIKDKTVLVLGAGGAANACVVMAVSNGSKKVIIANRTLKNAQVLKEHITKYYSCDIETIEISKIYDIESCDIVINSTTLGFGDNVAKTPIEDKAFFKAKRVEAVFDAIYSPWETRLLGDAISEGVLAINGFDMLLYQAVAAQEIWFEEKYPLATTESIKAELIAYYKEMDK